MIRIGRDEIVTKVVSGIAASSGIVIAKAFVLKDTDLRIERKKTMDPDQDIQRLGKALNESQLELEDIKKRAASEVGQEQAEIFSAHLLVLQDPEYIGAVKEKIRTEQLNAEGAVDEVTQSFIDIFENMDNQYMKERAADIRDVSKRIIGHLLNKITSLTEMNEEAIIVGSDLSPSDTAQLNREFVRGFTTDMGGRTSHSAIMARSMEIPAVVGTKRITEEVETGTLLVIDGSEGKVVVNPSDQDVQMYRAKQQDIESEKQEQKKLVHEHTVTSDGQSVMLAANIGSPEDLDAVINNGAEGVGLFRTEFLYMGRDELPDEEEQFEAYKTVLEKMEGKPVVIRTLDIGGDKELPYLDLPKELNPFLGLRAIRLCLENEEIFRTQLRALLRASVYGQLKVMFPMVAVPEEYRKAKEILLEEKEKLKAAGVAVADFDVGIMVEIPATAVMAEQFAKEVDFFSIGTNDLIQYTMAADRMNEWVSYLYQPYSPAILRLVDGVITAAHAEGKEVAMCGEMAGEETAVPLLLGLGLDEFSISASSILPTRKQLRKLSRREAAHHAKEAVTMKNSNEVADAVKDFLRG